MDDYFKLNRRTLNRIKTEIQAQYFIKKQSQRYERCTIVDISRSGAAIRFPLQEQLQSGSIIFLELALPRSSRQLTLQGQLRRIQHTDNELIGGIKFKDLLDGETFQNLTL